MINVVCIPYKDFKEKQSIFKENKDIKFTDLGNCLMNLQDIGQDEVSAVKLCWKEKNKFFLLIENEN